MYPLIPVYMIRPGGGECVPTFTMLSVTAAAAVFASPNRDTYILYRYILLSLDTHVKFLATRDCDPATDNIVRISV